MNKKLLSEKELCGQVITPAIEMAGWNRHTQIAREFVLKKGRIVVEGINAARDELSIRRADYVLSVHPGVPVAVIEAKDNNHSIRDGMQQALAYSNLLDVPFALSTNGDGFVFHDKTGQSPKVETELTLEKLPSASELWSRYVAWKKLDPQAKALAEQEYYPGKPPRYYQMVAINRAIDAVARGQDRILLVMATGTGKTYTAFQIIWRLWKAGRKKRILFLADRNFLVDQAKLNDFKPFGKAMTKISNREVDKSYEIYLSLYQAVSGTSEELNIYKEFSPDFFDLIIIDECHRGSADEDSIWHDILTYFKGATHIGMTATPKETRDVSNISYFGEPIYTYSLRQGIEDGYLAPYKVIRVNLDTDVEGWRPQLGQVDKFGHCIEDRVYDGSDINRTLVITERDELVAARIAEWLRENGRYSKSIVFCEDIDHAARMREALVNACPEEALDNDKYVMRITGDNEEGKNELDNFIDPEKRYPVVVTTSRLLATGADVQTCKLIVLDRNIRSMTEFKQIIGRGTRINEDFGKLWFTILDFKNATELFLDPAFDGEPVSIYEPQSGDPITPELYEGVIDDLAWMVRDVLPIDRADRLSRRYVVEGVPVFVLYERVQYVGPDGRLITESLRDYSKAKVLGRFESLDKFLREWHAAERKQAIIDELRSRGVFFEALAEEIGQDLDAFDLICHVAFGEPPLTRAQRAKRARSSSYFARYSDMARGVLKALVDKYADEGISNIESLDVLRIPPLNRYGSPVEIIRAFGGKAQYISAVRQLEDLLYA